MKLKDEQKIVLIYKATLTLIGRTGIAGISMAAVAKEAGLATGTLYTYFESKEQLITSLYRESKKRSTSQLFADYNPEEPFRVSLRKIWFNYLQNKLTHYEEAVFQEQYYNSPYAESKTVELSILLLSPLYQLLERGKKELLVKDIDSNLLIIHFLGPIRDLVSLIRIEPKYAGQQWLELSFKACWDSIKA